MIHNLEWNQLVVWKLAWGIWQILTWSLESLKNIHFNGLLLSKVYIVWAKKVQRSYLSWHWRVIQNSERNRLNVCFKIDMRTLINFDLSTWKFQKNFPLIGSFWVKYILFELKEYRGVTLKSDTKFGDESACCFKLTWGIWQIFTRALESVKIGTLMGTFCPKQKIYELKIYRRVMCHDNEEWHDMRNLMNFDSSTQKSKKFAV